MSLHLLFAILTLLSFIGAAAGVKGNLNLTAVGLAFLTVALVLT